MVDPRLLQAVGDFLLLCRTTGRPTVLGIAGPNGSGKSTLGRLLAKMNGGVCISLDDVYLTRFKRRQMAENVHSLFATRGVPSTHDLALLDEVLDALLKAGPDTLTPLPVFDKLADDRQPRSQWPVFKGRPQLIVLEGWCLGCLPQSAKDLSWPVNALERLEDPQGRWRKAANSALATGGYGRLRSRLDGLIYMRPPSYDIIRKWRYQQEAQLMGVVEIDDTRKAHIDRFLAHFERYLRWMMRGGVQADFTIQLDENRQLVALS